MWGTFSLLYDVGICMKFTEQTDEIVNIGTVSMACVRHSSIKYGDINNSNSKLWSQFINRWTNDMIFKLEFYAKTMLKLF